MTEETEAAVAAALAVNRARWDARARIHAADRSGFYGVEAFLAGETRLDAVASGDLQAAGARVAHLQCHIGLDTLKLKRLGAAEAAGLDFSAEAIAQARALAARAGLPARFVQGEVGAAPALLGAGAWDLVYVTWGTICWLPELRSWAGAIAALLRPGGRLFFRDMHPFAGQLDVVEGRLLPVYGFRTPRGAPLRFAAPTSYSGDADPLPPGDDHEWNHPVSEILGALLGAGLRIDGVEEGEALPWDMYPGLTAEGPAGVWRLPEGHAAVPLSLTVRASRPG